MANKSRVTPQKAKAIALHRAGLPIVQACEEAGYARADTAAKRLFRKNGAGEYADAVVRGLLADEQEPDPLAELLADVEAPGADDPARAILWGIARDVNAPTTARVQAASKLLPARESKHRDDMVEGEECTACGFVKGADGDTAAASIRRLLGIAA